MSAGTIMHRNHLSLKTWFTAVHIVTSHSNGISARNPRPSSGSAATSLPGCCCTSCAAPWSRLIAVFSQTSSKSMR